MTAAVFEQIRTIASDLFAVAPNRITADSSPENIESWDSIQHLNLVLAIEERFSLQLSPEEIEEMKSIGGTVRLIENKLQATPR